MRGEEGQWTKDSRDRETVSGHQVQKLQKLIKNISFFFVSIIFYHQFLFEIANK